MTKLGRPSKYTPEILGKAKAYVNGGFLEEGDVVPIVEGMAMSMGVSRKTVYEWAQDSEKQEFSDILESCNQKQTRMLMSGSLIGDLNANITKLMLGKQGYSEKHQQEITGSGGGPVQWVVQPVKAKDA